MQQGREGSRHSPLSPADSADSTAAVFVGDHEPYGHHAAAKNATSDPTSSRSADAASHPSATKPSNNVAGGSRNSQDDADGAERPRPQRGRGGDATPAAARAPTRRPATSTEEAKKDEDKDDFAPYIARGRLSQLHFRDVAREHAERKRQQEESRRGLSHAVCGVDGRKRWGDGDDQNPDPPPDCVRHHRDMTRDGYSWWRISRSLTHLIEPVYFALKVATLVTLPLCVLAFSEPAKNHFQAGSLLVVVGTANAQLYVGSQLSSAILLFQGACWLMLWGTVMNSIGVPNHDGAWWGLAFTSVILVSFFPNFRSRKLMMSYGIMVMQMERTPGGAAISRPANVAADVMMAVALSCVQCFVPFPKLVIRQTDRLFGEAWREVGAVASRLRTGVWCSGAYGGYIAAVRSACDGLGVTIADMPAKLFLITYEPFERSLWNQLRNVRLSLLRRLLVVLYAACSAAELVTSMNSPERRAHRAAVVSRLEGPMDDYLAALMFTLEQLGHSLDPATTVANCQFAELIDKKDAALKALQDCIGIVAKQNPGTTDAPAFYAFIYFHLLLLLLAEELRTVGDQMAAFDPSQYKSTWRRFLEFFFIDFWNDFRYKLPGRLTLRTDADVRCLKEGIKLACAYCVAAAFTLRLNDDHTDDTYYFGMSIILGIGLPTASESIEVGIQRICGMAFALAIGYLAEWKTQNLAQAIAIIVSGTFIAVCFRGTQRYMHVAYYASFIAPAAYNIAHNRVTMISRVVDNSFAVMSYLIICAFMFPINPFRVLWNKRILIHQTSAELITQLASMAEMPLTEEHEDIAQAKLGIASEKLRLIEVLMAESKTWAAISAKEPIVIGNAFPAEKVKEIQTVMTHLVAGLEVWLFGLQILHRKRPSPPQPAVHRMVEVLGPILEDVETISRFVFQDLIDAIELPLQWSLDRSYRHFGDFVSIKARLDATFHELHRNVMKTQDPALRQRAVAAALARGVDLTSPSAVGNQSFIATTLFAPDPRNVRGVPDNGVYDVHDELFPHVSAADERAAAAWTSRNAAGAAPSPKGANMLEAGDSTASRREQATNQLGNTSFAPASDAARQSQLRMSFRVPVGNLPVDVDVTAITIIITSIGTLISTLEGIVPLIGSVNAFERSRLQPAFSSLKEFFMSM